jgi:type I restriction enzyme, S subunit
VRLSDVSDIGVGVTLGRELGAVNSVELPYLRVANVQDGRIDTSDVKKVRVLPSEVSRYRLQKGDILLTEGGDFDKLGRGAVWDGSISNCLHQNHIFSVRVRDGIVPEFFAAYVASTRGRNYFLSCAKQTTNLASINKSQLSAMPVPIPPESEQRRIAEILDSVDEGINASERCITKLAEVEWALLSDLLRNVTDAASTGSDGWQLSTVRETGSIQLGRQRSPEHESGNYMAPYLRVANVFDGYIDYSDVLTMNFTPSERRVYDLKLGDILLNEGQSLELVGRCAIYDGTGNIYFQNTLIRYRSDLLLPEFARAVFKYWLETSEFTKVAKQTTSIAHLGASRFGGMPIPVASKDKQSRVANVLSATSQRITEERVNAGKLRSLKQGLMDDLLTGRVRVTSPSAVPSLP